MERMSGDLRGRVQALFLVLFLWNMDFPLWSQGDPAAVQDAVIERQKLLKAADQVDLVAQQNGQLQQDVQALKERIKKLETDNIELKKSIEEQEKARVREKEALLKEVSKIVASGSGGKASSTKEKETRGDGAAVQAGPKGNTGATQQGYEYTVEAGQNLWAIAKAYQDKGVKVTVEDIRKANNLGKDQPLKTGQQLFIPKK